MILQILFTEIAKTPAKAVATLSVLCAIGVGTLTTGLGLIDHLHIAKRCSKSFDPPLSADCL